MQNPANNRYYILDALGHTRALLDNQGHITDTYVYDAWGNLNAFTGATPNPFTWNGASGYQWIDFTGLYHIGAREYDPRVGRWLQRDPIDVASGDPNLYRYAGNDPVNEADPSGLDGFKVSIFGYDLEFDKEVVEAGLKTGLAAVGKAFSFGLWDGGKYKNEPGFEVSEKLATVGRDCLITAGTLGAGEAVASARAAKQVQQAANKAKQVVGAGKGHAHGTKVHTEFAKQVKQASRGKLKTEVSYKNGEVVPHGTKGSVRLDTVRGKVDKPKEVWDLKTGDAKLTPKRVQEIRRQLPPKCQNIPIREVRPK